MSTKVISLKAWLDGGPCDGQLRCVGSLTATIRVAGRPEKGSYRLLTDDKGKPVLSGDGSVIFGWQP